MRPDRAGLPPAVRPPAALGAQWDLFCEAIPAGALFLLGPDGRVAGWNRGAEHLFGHAEADVLGQPFALLFTPEDRAAGEPGRELRAAEAGGRAPGDPWHVRPDGSRLPGPGLLTPPPDQGGGLRRFAPAPPGPP